MGKIIERVRARRESYEAKKSTSEQAEKLGSQLREMHREYESNKTAYIEAFAKYGPRRVILLSAITYKFCVGDEPEKPWWRFW